MIKASCPKCGNVGQFEARFAGMQARCGRCQAKFVIPKPQPADEPPPLPGEEEPPPMPVETPPPMPQEDQKPGVPQPHVTTPVSASVPRYDQSAGKPNRKMLVAGGICAAVIVVALLVLKGRSSPPVSSDGNAQFQSLRDKPDGTTAPRTPHAPTLDELRAEADARAKSEFNKAEYEYIMNAPLLGPEESAINVRARNPAAYHHLKSKFFDEKSQKWVVPPKGYELGTDFNPSGAGSK